MVAADGSALGTCPMLDISGTGDRSQSPVRQM
jgi:hypothetical protein